MASLWFDAMHLESRVNQTWHLYSYIYPSLKEFLVLHNSVVIAFVLLLILQLKLVQMLWGENSYIIKCFEYYDIHYATP
jgi:hypothetical protein